MMMFTAFSDPTTKNLRPLHSSIVQFWRVYANLACFPVVSWQEWHPVWSPGAVVHVFQGLISCAFRHTLLHTLGVMSEFVSDRVCLKFRGEWPNYLSPVNSDVKQAF